VAVAVATVPKSVGCDPNKHGITTADADDLELEGEPSLELARQEERVALAHFLVAADLRAADRGLAHRGSRHVQLRRDPLGGLQQLELGAQLAEVG